MKERANSDRNWPIFKQHVLEKTVCEVNIHFWLDGYSFAVRFDQLYRLNLIPAMTAISHLSTSRVCVLMRAWTILWSEKFRWCNQPKKKTLIVIPHPQWWLRCNALVFFTKLIPYYPGALFVCFYMEKGAGELGCDAVGGFCFGLSTDTFSFPVIPSFLLPIVHVANVDS
jgi:hypothetical protein